MGKGLIDRNGLLVVRGRLEETKGDSDTNQCVIYGQRSNVIKNIIKMAQLIRVLAAMPSLTTLVQYLEPTW